MTAERIERFWAKVDVLPRDGCWLWIGAKDGMGYGLFGVRPSRCERAHRVSWRIKFGEIPDGMCVLHRCDNPACVRPDHLFLGTRDDNMRDRQTKRRQARGERGGRARLTAEQVLEMRHLRAMGARRLDLATKYGVAPETIGAACTGRSWRHL